MNILPIVVLYNSNIKDSSAITFLLNSNFFKKIFVYDNTPSHSQDVNTLDPRVEYIHDPSNPGVSKAYNVGGEYAIANSFDWLLILDQDTVLTSDLINSYISAHKNDSNIKLFAPYLKTMKGSPCSPCRIFFKRGFPLSKVQGSRRLSLKKYAPINSGILINTELFHSVSGYNEKVFLDFSDFQFIERLSEKIDYFFLLDYTLEQDFSNDSDDLSKLLKRFSLYCQCARACHRYSLLDSFQYLVTVFVRMLSLILRTKSFSFFKCFKENYWRMK